MYDRLARFYDELIDKAYYDKWLAFAKETLRDKKSGVDVGCGSGAFTIGFAESGKKVVGMDESAAMLERAMQNARAKGLDIKFVLQKAEKLRCFDKVGFVTAMNDVVNYMKNPTPFFQAAFDALERDGLLFFDVSSEYKLENRIAAKTFFLESERAACVWENSEAGRNGAVDMTLHFFEKREDGLYERSIETQRQYIHRQEDIVKKLKEIGFEVKVCADLAEKKPKADSERIHFIAKKV